MSSRTWIVIGAVALLVTVPVAMKLSRGGESKPVDMEPIATHVLSPTILASGALTYQAEVKLVSEVIGKVREVLVKEGDQVKKGQLLLQLDPAQAQAQVAQLEASLAQSRLAIDRTRVNAMTLDTKWKRFQALREQGLVDQNSFDDIASQRNMAQVELESSGQMMQQTQAPGQFAQGGYNQPYGGPQPPMGGGSFLGGGGGGSFLGTAAAAAAGMVGGSLLLGSIRSMMGGGHHGIGDAAGLHNAGDRSASQAPWSDQSGSSLARDAGIDSIGSAGGRADDNSRAGLFDTASNDDDHDDMDLDSDDFDGDGDSDNA